ncbi:sulfatase-like hydrolase/transferase [Crenobacter caeni]|uniref:Lipid A phosphoethanolamine transferase n=1 Tax=Crenobacter caeni TaxID=2705474 RepID=A0A6B2KU19_9NEIS|nr:phosphoethanolamine transferase [Crenobacter caeni]NDV13467.1 lipid A phosphoethanolamine transferase [Crenobacter caeni]
MQSLSLKLPAKLVWRNGWGWLLFSLFLAYAFVLMYYPFAEIQTKRLSWVVVNALTFFLLARLPGMGRMLGALLIGLLFSINLSFIWFYGSRLTGGAIASAFETNPHEALGFIEHVGVLPFALFAAISALIYWLAGKVQPVGRKGGSLLLFIVLFPLLNLLLPAAFGAGGREAYEFKINPVSTLSRAYLRMQLLTDAMAVASYRHEMSKLMEESTRPRSLLPGTHFERDAQGRPDTIVLVIGESAAKGHYGLYGYRAGADRAMQDLASQHGHALVVDKAVAPAPITRESLVRVLSFASARDDQPFVRNLNLVEMARQAGYQTVWLSNQSEVGRHDTSVGVMANTADQVYFNRGGGLDIRLLDRFRQVLRPGTRQLIVLHLQGSHLAYARQHDNADWESAASSTAEVRHYDATVAHTDRVLAGIVHVLPRQTSLMLYVPDHGEIVNKGHGFLAPDARQYDIPMLVWGGESHVASIANALKAFREPSGVYFNTVNLPFVLSETMGYRFSAAVVQQARNDAAYLFNVDGQVLPLSALER